MPAVSRPQLHRSVLESISDSGGIGLAASGTIRNPGRYFISLGDLRRSLWVYLWTLTPGGRPSLPHEYRIQLTSVRSPLRTNPRGLTVLLGYEPNIGVWAGFDLARHSVFTEGSPSVQVDVRTLQQALQDGLSFERKANDEIAIGFRSDQFIYYCQHAVDLHHFGTDVAILPLLERAAERQDIPDQELMALPQERERIVRETARLARAANFRLQVLQAYDSRCAVTRWQMKIVDAAHILPVAAPESVDDVRNGIALSATYHRAFDSGLIYLDEDLVMHLNRKRAVQLGQNRLGDGLDSLAVSLGRIHLPPDPHQWPDVRFIRFANRYRNISA